MLNRPQVEKICIDKGLTDETEILRFLQHGTLVGLLPVPHPILIRKYQVSILYIHITLYMHTLHIYITSHLYIVYINQFRPKIFRAYFYPRTKFLQKTADKCVSYNFGLNY
jgi:hypothetical protein